MHPKILAKKLRYRYNDIEKRITYEKWSIMNKKRGAQKMKQRREKGITLIALVITIALNC